MIATLFINGRRIGEIEYGHPRDADGKIIATPAVGKNPGLLSVHIDGDEHQWFATADLLDVSK